VGGSFELPWRLVLVVRRITEGAGGAGIGTGSSGARDAKADLFDPALTGEWRDAFTGEAVKLDALVPLEMKAWRYRVLVR
jgi:hypothetical protein